MDKQLIYKKLPPPKNTCLICSWYQRERKVCLKPVDSGYCRITRSV